MNVDLIEQDKKQRQQALDPTKSFIVQAPAGSGKTELLIQRCLTLLNNVKSPEEILAITFTKKAANEMRMRVIKALKHALNEPEPNSAHAKQTWLLAKQVLQRDAHLNWNLINNPNQLRIQTIDALCSFLTKQLPMLSHFGSQPDIADNPDYIYRDAVKEVLSHVEENYEWSAAISHLLLHLDNDLNKLHELLISLLARRDQWLPYIQLNSDDKEIKKQLERHLALVITESLTAIHTLFPDDISTALLNIIRYAADHLALSNPDSEVMYCRDLHQLPGTQAKDKKAWLGIAKFLLTTDGEWRKSFDARIGMPAASGLKNSYEKQQAASFKADITQIMQSLHDHDDLRTALYDLTYLPEPYYQDNQWRILQSLLFVLKIVAAQLRVTFQQYGQIDFIENSQAALIALGSEENPTNLALALDYQIKHILIDEFQDTSLSQYQLLEKLITGWETDDGRTLFVVGDPMQSIYRFREAEVGLFIRMRSRGIGHVKLIPLTLSVNFRSAANIVTWNNHLFSRIFPTFNDMATGAVTYSPSAAHQTTQHDHALIEVKGFATDIKQTQAASIVTLIEKTKDNYPHETIAILVRSRPHLKAIIPALKQAKIPYRAVDIDPLSSRQNIQDLVSLTCALLHPADRISWLALLRAPWCGLSLADLLIIAGENKHASIWERLTSTDVIKNLSSDGQARLRNVIPILNTAIGERDRHDLRSWVENTWLLLGGPACMQDYAENADTQVYFKLLTKLTQQDQTLNIDKLKEKINGLYAAAQYDDTAVQIMTIHSAKGLEFDTVILPHLENKPAIDSSSLLLWMEQPLSNDQVALMLAPIHAIGDDKDYIYAYVNRQHSIKNDYEIDRLFYVATTRAKKRLHLFFNTTANEKGDYKLESWSFLKKIWPLIENNHAIISHPDVETISIDDSNTRQHRPIIRLSATWQNPIVKPTTTIAAHQQAGGFHLNNTTPRITGVVIHRILQQLGEQGSQWWSNKSNDDKEAYIRQHLSQLGMLAQDADSSLTTVLNAIHNTMHDERGAWILQAHRDHKAEYALTAFIDNTIENLIIDRTFIDDQGVRWIIDYKTTTFTQKDLATFLVKEQEKYEKQMQKYYQAMQLVDERPIRLGLYFPALPAWKEW